MSPTPGPYAPSAAAASANRATAHRSPRGRGASSLARCSACVLTEPAGAGEDAARPRWRQATKQARPPLRWEAGAPRHRARDLAGAPRVETLVGAPSGHAVSVGDRDRHLEGTG